MLYALRLVDHIGLLVVLAIVVELVAPRAGSSYLSSLTKGSYQAKDVVGFALLGVGWFWILNSFIRYHTHRFRALGPQILDLVKATSGAALLLLAVSAAFSFEAISTSVIALFWLASGFVGTLSRLAIHGLLIILRRSGYNYRHLLIVGTNSRAIEMANRIESRPELGYKIQGFLSEDPELPASGQTISGKWRVIGPLDEFQAVLEQGVVDEVMICLPFVEHFKFVHRFLQLAREIGVVARLFPEGDDVKLLTQFEIERFEGECVVTLFRERLILQLFVKRLTDIAVSSLMLLVLSPLLLAVAIIIKATSPGPVFFAQERMGMNKRRFKLYKFRSMVVDAEQLKQQLADRNEMDGPVFKIKDDPRITPFGRFIRKTSIDELPQLLNVLSGEMSLVGPRPPLPEEVYRYEWMFRKRLSIKPGITCLWQISGRNNINFKGWMELDRQYIENWSIWLDFKILFKTIPAVLFGRGAS